MSEPEKYYNLKYARTREDEQLLKDAVEVNNARADNNSQVRRFTGSTDEYLFQALSSQLRNGAMLYDRAVRKQTEVPLNDVDRVTLKPKTLIITRKEVLSEIVDSNPGWDPEIEGGMTSSHEISRTGITYQNLEKAYKMQNAMTRKQKAYTTFACLEEYVQSISEDALAQIGNDVRIYKSQSEQDEIFGKDPSEEKKAKEKDKGKGPEPAAAEEEKPAEL